MIVSPCDTSSSAALASSACRRPLQTHGLSLLCITATFLVKPPPANPPYPFCLNGVGAALSSLSSQRLCLPGLLRLLQMRRVARAGAVEEPDGTLHGRRDGQGWLPSICQRHSVLQLQWLRRRRVRPGHSARGPVRKQVRGRTAN